MELRDLRYFLAVAETASFTRAAERLGKAQPPLSRHIAGLEARLKCPLFRRVRPLELTEAGRFLFEQARQVINKMEELEAATRRFASGRKQLFSIGFVGSTLYGPLPKAIRRFRDALPDVEIGLSELTTHEQRDALIERRIDVGFGRVDVGETPGLRRETLLAETLCLACAADHALAKERAAALVQIAAEPFVLYPGRPRPSYADQVIAIFREVAFEIKIALEVNDLQTALGLIAAGVGVTLVPASVAMLHREDIAFVPLRDSQAQSPIIVSYRENDQSYAMRLFLKLARATE
jgi:DNA-binding transcriptional LysR family regulator